jgi:predicted kinase
VLRKRTLGIPLSERAADDAYAPEKRAEIYSDLATRAAAAHRAGVSVVADATFRVANARQTIGSGAGQFHGIWLDAPLRVRLARIASRKGDASDADAEVAMKQEEPAHIEQPWRRIDARRPVREIAADILREIA